MEHLTESVPRALRLPASDAAALTALGRRLASSAIWWGQAEDGSKSDRSVVRVRPITNDHYEVRVADAVGAIAVGTTTIFVHPKIPQSHLFFLFACANGLPRLDAQRLSLAAGTPLWELVAAWCVNTTEALLRRGLVRDYHPHTETNAFVRGHADVLSTTTALLKGRVEITCEYDEFDADNALNRVLLAASHTISASTLLPAALRQRARRIVLRLDGIGDLQRADLRVQCDRRTHYYRDALALSKAVLSGRGRTLDAGSQVGWTFLLRTPELIEAGIRAVLTDGLAPTHSVTKKGRQLVGSTKTLNPDLVFDDGLAVGDVKYKITDIDWNTTDLYQVVAFAAGYRASKAAIVSFSQNASPLTPLEVGDVRVRHLTWHASDAVAPAVAAALFVADAGDWLAEGVEPSTHDV